MKKILVYKDEGVDLFGLSSLIWALKQEKIHHKYAIVPVDRHFFLTSQWQKEATLVVFPGGRDIPYHQALQGNSNQAIRQFIAEGGKFLGICAGGYYGSAFIEFEKGGPLQVLGDRELKFFPGIASGPAYGPNKFCYLSGKGAQIAQLNLMASSNSFSSAAYYNGGCFFDAADQHAGVSILARYADIERQLPAIISCQVGQGKAILSGIHPEYSAHHPKTKERMSDALFNALKDIEKQRRTLFQFLIQELTLKI